MSEADIFVSKQALNLPRGIFGASVRDRMIERTGSYSRLLRSGVQAIRSVATAITDWTNPGGDLNSEELVELLESITKYRIYPECPWLIRSEASNVGLALLKLSQLPHSAYEDGSVDKVLSLVAAVFSPLAADVYSYFTLALEEGKGDACSRLLFELISSHLEKAEQNHRLYDNRVILDAGVPQGLKLAWEDILNEGALCPYFVRKLIVRYSSAAAIALPTLLAWWAGTKSMEAALSIYRVGKLLEQEAISSGCPVFRSRLAPAVSAAFEAAIVSSNASTEEVAARLSLSSGDSQGHQINRIFRALLLAFSSDGHGLVLALARKYGCDVAEQLSVKVLSSSSVEEQMKFERTTSRLIGLDGNQKKSYGNDSRESERILLARIATRAGAKRHLGLVMNIPTSVRDSVLKAFASSTGYEDVHAIQYRFSHSLYLSKNFWREPESNITTTLEVLKACQANALIDITLAEQYFEPVLPVMLTANHTGRDRLQQLSITRRCELTSSLVGMSDQAGISGLASLAVLADLGPTSFYILKYTSASSALLLSILFDEPNGSLFSKNEQAILLTHLLLSARDVISDAEIEEVLHEIAVDVKDDLVSLAKREAQRGGITTHTDYVEERFPFDSLLVARNIGRIKKREGLASATNGEMLFAKFKGSLKDEVKRLIRSRHTEQKALRIYMERLKSRMFEYTDPSHAIVFQETISSLGPKVTELLMLMISEQLSQTQAAEALGISQATVSRLLSEARSQFLGAELS